MSRIVKSSRGEEVNFDLFDIKNQMLQAPKNDGIKQRERFIDKKRRKSAKKRIDELVHQKQTNDAYALAAIKADETTAVVVEEDALTVAPTPSENEKPGRRKIVK